jgi:hypothetical protein
MISYQLLFCGFEGVLKKWRGDIVESDYFLVVDVGYSLLRGFVFRNRGKVLGAVAYERCLVFANCVLFRRCRKCISTHWIVSVGSSRISRCFLLEKEEEVKKLFQP